MTRMALNQSHNADYWRDRAEGARAVAVQMLDPHTNPVISVLRKSTRLNIPFRFIVSPARWASFSRLEPA